MKTSHKNYFYLLAVLFFFGWTTVANGQLTFGAKAGLNLSNLSMENSNDKNMLTGIHAGVFANQSISEKFSIQPELLFSQGGSKWTGNLSNSELKLNLSYIQVPVSAVYSLAKDFDFLLGPYVGFLMKEPKFKGSVGSGGVTLEPKKDYFNSLDFGMQGGMRFFLKPVYVGFSYNLGISQVAKKGKIWENVLDNASSRVIQVYAAIPF